MSVARQWQPDAGSPVVRMQSPDEQRPAGRLLGDELRRHRERLGLTLAEAARVIRGSTSKMSRLERGESPAKPRDVHDLARHYRLSGEEQHTLEQLLAQAGNAEWYEQFADVTPHFLKRLIQTEGRAEKISIFENQVVPGLLQTEGYARALIEMMELPDSETDRIVGLRIARQLILDQDTPRILVLLDQTVLERRRGSAAVMRDQMKHLLEASMTRKVNVRIIGMDSMTPPYPITHLTFPEGGPSELAYVEHVDSATYVTKKRTLDSYRKVLANVRNAARSWEESTQDLKDAVAHWEERAAEERSG